MSVILKKELDFAETGLVTITRVQMTPELKLCRIFYSPLSDDKIPHLAEIFKLRGKYFKGILSHRVQMRHMPEVEFVFDTNPREVAHLESIFNEISKDQKKKE